MHRQKGTPNTPQAIIDEIVAKHAAGALKAELSREICQVIQNNQ